MEFQQYDQANTRKRSLIIIAVYIVAFSIWGVANVVAGNIEQSKKAALVSPNTPNKPAEHQLFYAAVENHMKVDYITQKIEGKVSDDASINLDANSDFTDPGQPKTKLSYTISSSEPDNMALARDQIIVGTDLYASIPTVASQYAEQITAGGWYHIPADNGGAKLLFDTFGTGSSVNSSLGEIVVGKFSDDKRKALMKYINDNDIYKIQSTKLEKIDGKDATHYIVTFDGDKVTELNKKAAVQYGLSQDTAKTLGDASKSETLDIWVNNNDKRFIKAIFTHEDSQTKAKQTTTTKYQYLKDNPNISKPENVLEAPQVIVDA